MYNFFFFTFIVKFNLKGVQNDKCIAHIKIWKSHEYYNNINNRCIYKITDEKKHESEEKSKKGKYGQYVAYSCRI